MAKYGAVAMIRGLVYQLIRETNKYKTRTESAKPKVYNSNEIRDKSILLFSLILKSLYEVSLIS